MEAAVNQDASKRDPRVDLERLLKLRLIVARHGEMDRAGWWNTNGILGRHGALALQRGFPSTHHFAQARIAFAVARSRCHALFDPPGCMTLWSLPARIEDQFEEHWQDWLDQGERWSPFFAQLASTDHKDLLVTLAEAGLVDQRHLDAVGQLRRSAEGRSVPLPGTHQPNDETITLLAAGFAKGERGHPAIAYARLEE
ncbi:MAG: BrxE family protein [Thiocapsa sp.]|uniref:BrxE family protein n=1 Tax=Thiocapsa sp. TaxID=2024551 RepID=UPI001BCB945F|nr:BrxE family protein [Thiocapsa sp.]QVL47248.1 MAG: BrxE family protein [Thiocapsa sp.]